MSNVVTLTADDGISADLSRRIKRARDMRPAMKEVERQVMQPLRASAWKSSGLKSRSGELKKSVVTFAGKKSAGISVHTTPGHDLVIPKAVTLSEGRRRREHRKRDRTAVKSHTRKGRRISGYVRRNVGSPWGNIKARPFIPDRFSGAETSKITAILTRYLDV